MPYSVSIYLEVIIHYHYIIGPSIFWPSMKHTRIKPTRFTVFLPYRYYDKFCLGSNGWPLIIVYFLSKRHRERPYLKSSISRLFCFIHKHFSSLKFKTSIMQCTLKAHSMNWVLQVMSTRLRNISFQYGLLYCQQSLPGGEIDGSVFMCLNCPVDSCNKETEVTGGEKFLSKFFHT